MPKPEHSADDHRKISEREHHHDNEQSPVLVAVFNELRGIRIEAGEIGLHLGCIKEQFRDLLRFLECTKQNPQGGHADLATKQDLKETENKIMAVLAEVVADLKEAIVSAKQTNLDIADTQKKIDTLTAKVKELEDAIAAGGTSQELADLAKEVKALTKAADDALPNPIVVPDVPV